MKKYFSILTVLICAGMIGCHKEQVIPVNIDVSYSIVNNSYTVPVFVSFSNNTTGAENFKWTFEGGTPSTSTQRNPGTIEFRTGGSHKVRFEAWNDDERQATDLIIELDSAVQVAFDTAVVINNFSPVTVKLTNKTTGGKTFSWTFEGGNPATSTLPNPPDVVFNTVGDHNITLQVSNGRENFTLTKKLTVAPTLTAGFDIVPSFEDEDYEAPLTATLQNSTLSGLTWQWSSSGGVIDNATSKNPSVYFANPGSYSVTLTAGNGKSTQTVTKTITVKSNSNLRTHADVQLGIASSQNSVGSFYSTLLRRTFKQSDNLDTAGKWIDIVFFGINQNFKYNKFISPDSAQAYTFNAIPQAQAVKFINSQEVCGCGAGLSATQFDAMTTDALLQGVAVNPTQAGWQQFDNGVPNRVVLFQAADGRKGVIKIKQYVQNGSNSYIVADIKVQKK